MLHTWWSLRILIPCGKENVCHSNFTTSNKLKTIMDIIALFFVNRRKKWYRKMHFSYIYLISLYFILFLFGKPFFCREISSEINTNGTGYNERDCKILLGLHSSFRFWKNRHVDSMGTFKNDVRVFYKFLNPHSITLWSFFEVPLHVHLKDRNDFSLL